MSERVRENGRERATENRAETRRERGRTAVRDTPRARRRKEHSDGRNASRRGSYSFEANTIYEEDREHSDTRSNQQQGAWIQVRGRRKNEKKTLPEFGREVDGHYACGRNISRGRGSTLTWRDRPDVTSFYFSHFPYFVQEKQLWRIFQEWGKVWEVFIPTKRNKQGHRYGFVHFKGVENEDRLERKLDNNIYINDMKMFVNKPKFQRGGYKADNTQTGTISRTGGQIMEDEPFHQPKHHHTLPSKTKTYAEVVKQHNLQEGKGVQGITSGEAITDDKIEPIVIQTEKSKTKWLDKVWVGHLKNEGMFDRVEEELQEMQGLGGTKVKSAYWGEDMVILHDLDEVTVNIINQRELVTGATPFSSIQKWTPMMVPSYRLTWLLIWGVPLQAWDAEYIADIVATCGELVELDPATEDKSRMNIARVLIRTKGKPLIAQKLSVIVDGCRHSLEVREDTVSGWGRKRRLKPNEGLFSSPFSTDMEDEDDEPNTYDHRWISPDGLTVSNVGASPTQRPSFGKRIHRRGRRDSEPSKVGPDRGQRSSPYGHARFWKV